MNTKYVRALRNGQITIPADFRKAAGLDEAAILQVTLDAGEIRIRPHQPEKLETGSDWLRDLYLFFESVRQSVQHRPERELDLYIDTALATLGEGSIPCTE